MKLLPYLEHFPCLVNDPLREVLPFRVEELGQFDGANFLLEQQAA